MTETDITNLALSYLGGRPLSNLDTDTTQQGISLRKWFDPARDEVLASHPWNFSMKRHRKAIVWTAFSGVVFSDNGGLIRATISSHGLSTGDRIHIKDVQGLPNANGSWYVTVISSSVFDLQDSTFSGAHTSDTGSWVQAPAFGWSYRFILPADFLRAHVVNGHEFNEQDSKPYSIESGYLLTESDVLEMRYIFKNEDTTTWDQSFINAFALLLASYCAQDITGPAGKAAELRQQYERMIAPMAKARDSRQGKGRASNPSFDSDVVRARRGWRY